MKIQIIIGSTRQNRVGDKVGKFIFEQLKQNKEVEAELIDLRDWPLPFFDEPASPLMSGGKYTNELGQKWADKLSEADGYIFIVAEYNHGYTAVLKNALDWAYFPWNQKPAAFVSYGGISGGTRAVQQLRQVVLELQMVPLRNGVHIPFVWQAFDENGNLKAEVHGVDAMFEQLIYWTKGLKKLREEKE